jgi:hypothetical protein
MSSLSQKFYKNERYICLAIGVLLAIVGAITAEGYQNNFKIFQGAYFHFIENKPMYNTYPEEYFDFLLYGPFFSLIIGWFCQLWFHLDKVLWVIFNTSVYLYAVDQLFDKKNGLYFAWILICFQDIYISGLSFEITNSIIGVVIFSFVLVLRQKVFLSGLLSGLFAMVKLFPILSLLFISIKKGQKFILGFIVGVGLAIIVPMMFSSYEYTLKNYLDWTQALILKDALNRNLNSMIDYSLPGMIRKNFENPNISSVYFVLFGFVILFGLFVKNYFKKNLHYELLVLAILTSFVFNSSSESPTIIISSTAVAIWWNFVEDKKTLWSYLFLFLYMLLTALPSIDGYPKEFKYEILHQRGFRALMPTFLWFYVAIKSYRKNISFLNN